MKMIFHIVIKTGLAAIMLMIVLMTSAFPVQADDPDENTLAIIELINQIRLDPLTYAEGLGYDRQTLLTDLPWLGDYALGIEALTVQDFLNQRAFALNSDDPLTEEPVPTLDTDFAFTGDIGGVVAFINFMDPATAIEIVVNNQLASELDPLYEGIRYILSSVYSYLGADFRSGRTMYKSGSRNAYYISITFGSSRLTSEVQVVNMINQMRAMPFKTYEALSLDTTFLPGNFSPLFFNEPLSLTAAAGLYSEIDFSAYAAYYGFQGAGVEGSSIIESFPEADSDLHALWTFYSLILNEMKTYPDKNTIFHSLYNGIGSALYYVNADSHHDIKLTPSTITPSDWRSSTQSIRKFLRGPVRGRWARRSFTMRPPS